MAFIIKCPGCGADLNVKNPDQAKVLYCSYCGYTVEPLTGEGKKPDPSSIRPKPSKSALSLGKTGSINDITYQVIGRIRYRDTRTKDFWDEWLLLSENGQYLWLQEEDWEFILMHKYTPKVPFDPNTAGGEDETIEIDGYRLEIEDNSEAVIEFFEGELTWKAEVGEKIKYLDAWKDELILYSCEWTEKEITYFLGREIPAENIYTAFNLGTLPKEALEEGDDEITETPFQQFTRKLVSGPFFKFTLLFGLLAAFTALFLGLLGSYVRNEGYMDKKEDGVIYLGPFNLNKKGGVYRIDTKITNLNNAAVMLEGEMLDESGKPSFDFVGEYYSESGVDGGESWKESREKETVWFVLNEPGRYVFKLKLDKPELKPQVIPVSYTHLTLPTIYSV